MPNRLAESTSPYLLQHRDNPVDWYEWGPDAFAAARLRDVPIVLSVGYSACHWCHVMAHESFEDPATAAIMNDQFVNVKVDREERPDVDRVYMDAVQAATGRGGWPMTVFLAPDGRPFFAGTYFPKTARHGMPSFVEVLAAVTDAWRLRRGELTTQADRLTEAIRLTPAPDPDLLDREGLRQAFDMLVDLHDDAAGGFGGAPKFPQAPTLEFVMRTAALDPTRRDTALYMLRVTLGHMARGGIYDHLGGGFSRYSVDGSWLVPHFEKMLYDNALLARVYLRSWQLTGDDDLRRIGVETLDYLLRDMLDPSGGIHAAEDADSEGAEGKFYVWTWDQLGEALGSDRQIAAQIYGATREGNFEGANILHLPTPFTEIAANLDISEPELLASKVSIDERLRSVREHRIRPGRDDKIVTAWNGMALRALAEGAMVLKDDEYRVAAERLGNYLVEEATTDGGLVRSRRRGRGDIGGFADDYAAAATGLFALYQATGDTVWFSHAELWTRRLVERFSDPSGGFFATASDAEGLIARPKNLMDNPTPSDNSMAAEALLTLAAYTGDSDLDALVESVVRAGAGVTRRHPAFAGHLLAVWLTALHGIDEVAVVAPDPVADAFASVVWERFRPNAVVAVSSGADDPASSRVPLLEGRESGSGGAAYVCRDFVCNLPAGSAEELRSQLAEAGAGTA